MFRGSFLILNCSTLQQQGDKTSFHPSSSSSSGRVAEATGSGGKPRRPPPALPGGSQTVPRREGIYNPSSILSWTVPPLLISVPNNSTGVVLLGCSAFYIFGNTLKMMITHLHSGAYSNCVSIEKLE